SEISRQIDEADRLQGDADVAAQDLATGVRSDVEGVMIATQKADTAFRMLLAVRNRMMEAYEEVKQIRI
ncbi:MAG: flagellar hook-basal body complex protein FliE, partial [Phycisphaerae bacterium]|nr:flagellar hook-basal body complex protein FliE [Phycisphaerae bacterium]